MCSIAISPVASKRKASWYWSFVFKACYWSVDKKLGAVVVISCWLLWWEQRLWSSFMNGEYVCVCVWGGGGGGGSAFHVPRGDFFFFFCSVVFMIDLTWLHLALKRSFTELIRPLLIALIAFIHSNNTQETRFTENYTDGYFWFLSWRAQLWCAGERRCLLDIRFSSVLFSHSIDFLSTPNHFIYFSCIYRIDFLFKSHSLCIHNVRTIKTISWPGL